ncbi:MAG TPA: NAD(P)H-binding protein [Polyangiaceae bacterium]|nr:NAD(P)H-binding protein [Polyangiaceae bacterium]
MSQPNSPSRSTSRSINRATTDDTPPDPRPILVIGSTGTVGREVVRALLAKNAEITVLLRPRTRETTPPNGVRVVVGDLDDARTVEHAVAGARAVFFVNPHEPNEERYAENVLSACERTRTPLVFLGVHADARWGWLRALLRAVYGTLFPRYRRRLRIGERVFSAATKTQLLLASPFFQNEEVFRADILKGRYTQPLGERGVTQVDVLDIAEVAATLLLDATRQDEALHPRGCFPLTGPDAVSGPEAAAIWAEMLGRGVEYVGHDGEAWRAAIRQNLHGHKRDDWLKTYETLAKMAGGPKPDELRRTTELLGRAPRGYRAYVADAVAAMANQAL